MTLAVASNAAISPRKGLRVALWIVQGLLALGFGLSGFMKLTVPIAELAQKMSWVAELPGLTRFIGVAELAGALGLILPSATRIAPKLTAWAGVGLLVVMILAAGFHVMHGEANKVPVNVILGGMAAFVAWGRFRAAPIVARSAG
jgi:hypothetical protein